MDDGRMNCGRRATARALCVVIASCLSVCLLTGGAPGGSAAASGGEGPPAAGSAGQAATTVPGPWEIIVYEHPNYIGRSESYRLEPGMRQRLVPIVEPRGQVSSFLLGSKIAVALFPFPNFIHEEETQGIQSREWEASAPSLSDSDFNDRDISLILFPKAPAFDLGKGYRYPFGAFLQDERSSGRYHATFFPAPEWEWEREYAVSELGYADLDKNANLVFISRPSLVQLTLYEQRNLQGASITFPGAVPGNLVDDNLGKYGWSDRAASVKVTWTGPWLNTGPLSPYSTTYGLDIPRGDYKRLFVDAGPGECEAACDLEAQCKAFTWVRPGVQAPKAVCWLKSAVLSNPTGNDNTASGAKGGTAVVEWPAPPPPPSRVRGTKPVMEPPTVSGLKIPTPASPQSATAGIKAVPPATKGPYQYGVNLPGGDLKGLFMDGGPEECEKACNAEAQCLAFTWVKPGVQGPKAACWLKKSPVPAPQQFPDAVSGYKKLQPTKPPGNE